LRPFLSLGRTREEDPELGGCGGNWTAQYGRRKVGDSRVLVAIGQTPRCLGRYRAGGNGNASGPKPAEQVVVGATSLLQTLVVGQRANDQTAGFRHLLWTRHARRALDCQRSGPCGGTVPHADRVAYLEQVGGHRMAHIADSHKSDNGFHRCSLSSPHPYPSPPPPRRGAA